MKVLIFLLLFLTIPLMAQDAQYWGADGRDIEWNKATRLEADSTDFFGATATQLDTIGTDSVFYSNLIITNGDGYEGIFNLSISFDSLGVTPSQIDSIDLYLRRYRDILVHPIDYWDDWKTIATDLTHSIVYEYQIADSTWWKPCNGFQLRAIVRDVGFDSLGTPNVGPYIR